MNSSSVSMSVERVLSLRRGGDEDEYGCTEVPYSTSDHSFSLPEDRQAQQESVYRHSNISISPDLERMSMCRCFFYSYTPCSTEPHDGHVYSATCRVEISTITRNKSADTTVIHITAF